MQRFLLPVFIAMTLGLAACSPSGSDGGGDQGAAAQQADPLWENTYFATGTSNGDRFVLLFGTQSPNKVFLIDGVIKSGSTQFIYRRQIGTYTFSGSDYLLTSTYATCEPLGTTAYRITGDPADSVFVQEQGSATSIRFWNDKVYGIPGVTNTSFASMKEDVGCSLLAKSQLKTDLKSVAEKIVTSSRKPANTVRTLAPLLKSLGLSHP